jgi:hypothetical protein
MRRVLARDGRVTIGVPRPNEFFRVMDEALARHVGPALAAFVQAVFSLNNPQAIEGLLGEAGFRDSQARVETVTLELPPSREFLWQYIASTPLAEPMGQVSQERRAALEHEVVARWKPWTTPEGMHYEQEIVVATASR